jgi:hypothetical protein
VATSDVVTKDEVESTIGGHTTCVVCFTGLKSHMAFPCLHQSVCGDCALKIGTPGRCPCCRATVERWLRPYVV